MRAPQRLFAAAVRSGHHAQDRVLSGWGVLSSHILQGIPRRLASLLARLGPQVQGSCAVHSAAVGRHPQFGQCFSEPLLQRLAYLRRDIVRPFICCYVGHLCLVVVHHLRGGRSLVCAAPQPVAAPQKTKVLHRHCTLRQDVLTCCWSAGRLGNLLSDLQTLLHLSEPTPVSALYKHRESTDQGRICKLLCWKGRQEPAHSVGGQCTSAHGTDPGPDHCYEEAAPAQDWSNSQTWRALHLLEPSFKQFQTALAPQDAERDGRCQPQARTGAVCAWNAARRAFSVSALSSLRLTSGSPVTSSTPGVRGGANFSWYERPLAGWIQRPVTRSTYVRQELCR